MIRNIQGLYIKSTLKCSLMIEIKAETVFFKKLIKNISIFYVKLKL